MATYNLDAKLGNCKFLRPVWPKIAPSIRCQLSNSCLVLIHPLHQQYVTYSSLHHSPSTNNSNTHTRSITSTTQHYATLRSTTQHYAASLIPPCVTLRHPASPCVTLRHPASPCTLFFSCFILHHLYHLNHPAPHSTCILIDIIELSSCT